MSDQDLPEGIRLAKRVAALQGCSRSQAEALITAGAVQVDGQVVTDPARRVLDAAVLHLTPVAVENGPLTLLAHLSAQHAAGQMLQQVLAHIKTSDGTALPAAGRLARLRALLGLEAGQSGLAVWSDDPAVLRRLQDRQRPVEQEWRLATRTALTPDSLEALSAQGWRVSLSQQSAQRLAYRLVGKQIRGPELTQAGLLELHRLRIGQLGLAPLQAGQARLAGPGERF